MKKTTLYILLWLVAFVTGCTESDGYDNASTAGKISVEGEIEQAYVTRADDQGFADGDVIGVYIVDYNGTQPGTLQTNGNRATNLNFTFDEKTQSWTSAYDVYWKDKVTPIDVYGYYPVARANPDPVDAYEFSVEANQSTNASDGALGGYEQSDLLWGKVAAVSPTAQTIRLPMRHRMSCARIELAEGEGFTAGEFARTEKNVMVKGTYRTSLVDLSTGRVTVITEGETEGIIPYESGGKYRCIIVPQTVAAGSDLISLNIGGMPYVLRKNEAFEFEQGRLHQFTIRIDKKLPEGTYKLTLTGERITAWENDDVSHDAMMKEYVVVKSRAGHLKESILAAGHDYRTLRNLKITGEVNAHDFYFMRDSMSYLQSLNMKEMLITPNDQGKRRIPNDAMKDNRSLVRIMLPDKLDEIGKFAFYACENLTGSLVVPEGVTLIEDDAFGACLGLTGTLSLPSTLEKLGNESGYNGPFSSCGFTCELKLPEKLTCIGTGTFAGCSNLYGELHLPSKLKVLGERAFDGCENLTGSLEIPQGVTEIKGSTFARCNFNGTLTLHDGITAIGSHAFYNTKLRGQLVLPRHLVMINHDAFNGCDFSGELVIPSTISHIGKYAFAYNWRLMGEIDLPEGLITIGEEAFNSCRSIEGVIIPASVENIGRRAFNECYGINKIVCKGDIPAYVMEGAFDGVAKDNFTLEVPESALPSYQTAPGWCDFKRIAAHHELVCRPSVVCAINTEALRTLVIDAEGAWEVESQPDWCELSQTSGTGKTELTLSVKEMSRGAGNRDGKIVFKLKERDYTHQCRVSQYDYIYAEDQTISLQQASKGNRGGINIVIVGDGYDAKDISDGLYMKDMQDAMEHFFGVEPFKTYRNYFNAQTAIALSPESGIGMVNTIRYSRFGTTFASGVGLRGDQESLINYAKRIPTVNDNNINETLIIVIPNTTDYGGICYMYESGLAIAYCPKSNYGYPLDSRGVIQHEACGHGFGKLADEYIYHNAFIDMCGCSCCGHVDAVLNAKSKGWYVNVDVNGKMHEVTWSHLIFDPRYSNIVDIYEGAFMHSRGVFRSEHNSCMNNDIPYFSTISRESMVRRIKAYAGESFDFEEFVSNDHREAGDITRSVDAPWQSAPMHSLHHAPIIVK